ncbi:glycosyltransferase family 4 protein [Pseudomonas sp. UBA4194]|uniref:glycosyltransferase family 4 protein n=1 Tax=Pseudomonas sp. UBA4194 TaxID=1947317 RepID=UPI0026009317|nr:glycosyltransferase family 4 protein [Pseudomonas sp. UBA4194]
MPSPSPLRIGVLTHIKHPVRQPFAGGLEAFTHDVTAGLIARGHDVTLFASSGSDPALNIVPMWDDSNYKDGRRTCLSSEYIEEHHAYLKVMQGIDDRGLDVIFNNSLHYVPATMASMIRTPMLTVLHTPPFFELINAYSGDRRAGHFATISAANARQWQALLPECEVIPNGIDLQTWTPRDAPGEHAIWFGRLVPDKGAHLAMDAAKLAGIPLRLAGQAVDQGYFNEHIKPRLSDQCRYLGHLSRDELATELASACVALVTPRWEEPFGLVVAEALACGTPVAAFARGAIADLLTEATGALAGPDDVDGLAQAIRLARRKSRLACRLHAETHWGQATMLDRYESLLHRVAGRG